MTRVVNTTIPIEYFKKDKINKLEARIARFNLHKGDILRFNEVDENKKPTGRYFDKRIINFHKIHKATRRWKRKDLNKFGLYIFQMDDVK